MTHEHQVPRKTPASNHFFTFHALPLSNTGGIRKMGDQIDGAKTSVRPDCCDVSCSQRDVPLPAPWQSARNVRGRRLPVFSSTNAVSSGPLAASLLKAAGC